MKTQKHLLSIIFIQMFLSGFHLYAQVTKGYKLYSYKILVLGRDETPLYDAKVIAGDNEFVSNEKGMVNYSNQVLANVKVTASGYFSKKVNLLQYPKGSIVTVQLIKMDDITMPVKVYVKDNNNMAVAGASVLVAPGVSAVTDVNGYALASHKQQPGEYINVTVSANGFKDASKRVLVAENRRSNGGFGSITTPDPIVYFTLQKGTNERNVLYLVIEVLDDEEYKPVNGAVVKVQLSDGTSFSETTNNKGEVKFTDNEWGFQGTTARVIVTHNDYKEKWSDIPAELMTAKDRNDRRFLVNVTKKETGPAGKWDITWTDPYATYKIQWDVRGSGGSYQVKHKLISTNHPVNKQLIGQSWDDITLTAIGDGKYKLRRASVDQNPGNPGAFEQTATCTVTNGSITCEGTHKGSKITHYIKVSGSKSK